MVRTRTNRKRRTGRDGGGKEAGSGWPGEGGGGDEGVSTGQNENKREWGGRRGSGSRVAGKGRGRRQGCRAGRGVQPGTPPPPSLRSPPRRAAKVSDSVHGRGVGQGGARGHGQPPPVSLKARRRFALPIWASAGKAGKRKRKEITYSG